jgi:putative endonuclease
LFYIYIIRSLKSLRYYAGSTQHVTQRVLEHNSGRAAATRAGVPWQLLHSEAFQSRSEAMRRETKIKARGIARYLAAVAGQSSH